MNLNDRRLQAYQNLSKSDDERAKDSSIPAAKETIAKVTHESATAAVKALTQGGLLKVPVAPREADGK